MLRKIGLIPNLIPEDRIFEGIAASRRWLAEDSTEAKKIGGEVN